MSLRKLWQALYHVFATSSMSLREHRVMEKVFASDTVKAMLAKRGIELIPGLAPLPIMLAANVSFEPLTPEDFAYSAATLEESDWCLGAGDQLKWTATNGSVKLNGKPIHLKGLNWYGYETALELPQGLAVSGLDTPFNFMATHAFNAVRVPFSLQWALSDWNQPPAAYGLPADLRGLSTAQVFDRFMAAAGAHGILVLLDLHVLRVEAGLQDLWYDGFFGEEQVEKGWTTVLKAASKHWNAFAVDIKNEPHGTATWGHGNLRTDWNAFVERLVPRLAKAVPEWSGLYFVEGVEQNSWTEKYAHWWGGNLDGTRKSPIKTGERALDEAIVYSPHIYGPEVYDHPYFHAPDFPANLFTVWNTQFGWIEGTTGQAVVVGEWGGSLAGDAAASETQQKLGEFFVRTCIPDNFWWCLNAATAHNGNLFGTDYASADQNVLRLLHWVTPKPTRFLPPQAVGSRKGLCVKDGAYANARCALRAGQPLEATVQAVRAASEERP